ncbi:MAG: methyltransferase domain-containing protein, partial [Candidatus Promineifilaceae bacterium]
MKTWALSYLRCPTCLGELAHTPFDDANGLLTCHACNEWFPIWRSIPRMLPPHLLTSIRQGFLAEFGNQVAAQGLTSDATANSDDDLRAIKEHTIENFGFEWIEYARFGWDDPEYNIEHEKKVFLDKSLLKADSFQDKLVLDAGCGNGRYSHWANQFGGRVIGIDLGDGVESAAKNTADQPNIQIVQADIFNPPFATATFDLIFSIGVLMHTGDAHRATISLTDKLKPSGSITIHLYGKGNPVYEWVDRTMRERTIQMSIPNLQTFTDRLYRVRTSLKRVRLAAQLSRFVRIDPHPHCIFDWYAAPIAT